MARYIPYVFHQTWKSKGLPRKFRQLRATWVRHHGDYEHRFWTDQNNYRFLEKYYAWFLPTYKMYPEPIMRVDAVRYFILKHYGGIYVDLDFECLRPIDPLLENRHLVVGREPPTHSGMLRQHAAPARILCNAFMASAPQHPFWDHLIRLMASKNSHGDVLVSTGPLLVSEAYAAYRDKTSISVVPHRQLYPLDKKQIRAPRSGWNLNGAYAIHHWHGTWWRGRGLFRRAQRLWHSVKDG